MEEGLGSLHFPLLSYVKTVILTYQVVQVIDTTLDENTSKYPDWFPPWKFVSGKSLRYDQNMCLATCQTAMMHSPQSNSPFSHIPFGLKMSKPRGIYQSIPMPRNVTREEECKHECPKNREINSLLYDSMNLGSVFEKSYSNNSEYNAAVTLSSPTILVKRIQYQKTALELISEIGGHLGLMAGASLLTFFEFGEFIVILFTKFWGRLRSNAKVVNTT